MNAKKIKTAITILTFAVIALVSVTQDVKADAIVVESEEVMINGKKYCREYILNDDGTKWTIWNDGTGIVRNKNGWIPDFPFDKSAFESITNISHKINIVTSDILQINSEVDAKCSIFDLSGNAVVSGINIVGNSGYASISFNSTFNKPYYIVITSNEGVYHNLFYLSNNNQNIQGVIYESK